MVTCLLYTSFDTGNQAVADCSVYRSWRRDCIFGDCDSGYDCAVLFLSGSSGEGGIGVYRTFVQCRACGSDSVCILVPGNEVSAHRSGWICAGIVNYVYFELQIHIIKNRHRPVSYTHLEKWLPSPRSSPVP